MDQINIYEAKRQLSLILKRVQKGETILISNHNKPVAELRPIVSKKVSSRPAGLCRGEFQVPQDFNEPLPDGILEMFEP